MSHLPLGILAASGAGAAGAMELISTTVLDGTTASVTFNSLPQTYKHLQIRYTVRSSYSAALTYLLLSANGSYIQRTHYLNGNGASVSSSTYADAIFGNIPGSTATANTFAAGVIDILDYTSANKKTTFRNLTGFAPATDKSIALWSALTDTAAGALTSLSLIGYAFNNFASGTRFSLYGIKG